ncbi:MAG: PilZ domain-containing protein [Acidobacteriota bacterium]
MPFDGEVHLTFEDGSRVAAHASNISLGGMFIATEEPRPVGTSFSVEFRLTPDGRAIEGRGRVLWVREQPEGPEYPRGLGLRFLELTPGSRELIFQVVDRYVRESDPAADSAAERQREAVPMAPIESLPEALDEVSPETLNAAIEEAVDRQMPKPPETPSFGGLEAPRPPSQPPTDDSQAGLSLAASGASFGALNEGPESEDRPVFDFSPPPAPPEELDAGAAPPIEAVPPLPESPSVAPELAETPVSVPPVEAEPSASFGEVLPAIDEASDLDSPVMPAFEASPAVPEPAPATFDFSEPPASAPPVSPMVADEPAVQSTPESWDGESSDASFARNYGGSASAANVPFYRQPWLWILGALAVVALAFWFFFGRGPSGDDVVASAPPAVGQEAAVAAETSDESLTSTDEGAATESADEASAGEPTAAVGEPAGAGEVADGAPAGDSSAASAPAPAAPSIAAPAPAANLPPVRRVEDIRWERDGGATIVVVQGDGAFSSSAVQSFHLGGANPREVVKIRGIVEPFAGGSVEVGSAAVARVRTGHHVETDPDELHVVVDLTAASVELADVDVRGDRLRLRFQGP